ncbi:hypothetical protein [Vibrio ishigakensis]|uniref:hypothetical protein n=1 Tax=Vibrio ishigakensis TaxID=1481914 RepID=UPI0021C4505E|nr:hypothetical protein [Vibrio ishigakensis]
MKTINRKTLVEGKLQNILKHNPDLRFQVDELGSGRVQVVISEGWCAKSVPLILSRVDVIYLLLEDTKVINHIVDFCLHFEAQIEEGDWPLVAAGGLA